MKMVQFWRKLYNAKTVKIITLVARQAEIVSIQRLFSARTIIAVVES